MRVTAGMQLLPPMRGLAADAVRNSHMHHLCHADMPAVCMQATLHGHSAAFWLFLEALGLRSCGLLAATLVPLLHVAMLFLGPLVMMLLDQQQLKEDCERLASRALWQSPAFWRNYIVAPLSEEVVFRAVLMALLLLEVSLIRNIRSNHQRPVLHTFVCPRKYMSVTILLARMPNLHPGADGTLH